MVCNSITLTCEQSNNLCLDTWGIQFLCQCHGSARSDTSISSPGAAIFRHQHLFPSFPALVLFSFHLQCLFSSSTFFPFPAGIYCFATKRKGVLQIHTLIVIILHFIFRCITMTKSRQCIHHHRWCCSTEAIYIQNSKAASNPTSIKHSWYNAIREMFFYESAFPWKRSRFLRTRLKKASRLRILCGRPRYILQSRNERPWPSIVFASSQNIARLSC